VLSDEDKEARRQAMIRAAQERERAWDKKIATGKGKRKVDSVC
jgi:hypothetical protein